MSKYILVIKQMFVIYYLIVSCQGIYLTPPPPPDFDVMVSI